MKVLLVGSGGREHAVVWKIAQSPRLERLYIVPGNAGTASLGQNVDLPTGGKGAAQAIVAFCRQEAVDLVVVGPEAPLSAGLVDELAAAGIPAFGPCQAAAQIESSKAFAKSFMARHHIPTARFAVFKDVEAALEHLDQVDYPVVIKASGLAAGKGVLLPRTVEEAQQALRAMMVERAFGAAGDEVVIEERLVGEEVSLLAFCDGRTICPMPPAQDHKRLLDGDRGPNTGGMGTYAPAPVCPPELVERMCRSVLQPTVDGLRAEGMPFVGVLYAGLILTENGPQVLEFNARFGDPETQVILPLLDSDLLMIFEACVQGKLDQVQVEWGQRAAACVVLASEGYPDKSAVNRVIHGLDQNFPNATVFHAGTRLQGEQALTAGGRVLGVTGWAKTLEEALTNAYAAVNRIQFDGMQYRRDIGWRALAASTLEPGAQSRGTAYASAGVSIDAGGRAVELMREAVRSTYGPQVLAGIGAFGGLFDVSAFKEMEAPVLVASTDGVGTKVKLAAQVGRYTSIGHDLVNHCINDILVQGAHPLFFMDYFASSSLRPEIVAEIVAGMSAACRRAGCALLGGETAEMPGVYAPGEFDVVGTIVGVVERRQVLPRPNLQAGDLVLGLRSSGPHTNGYSLIRKVFEDVSLEAVFPGFNVPLADILLAPHRSYLPVLSAALAHADAPVKALAHITGGGLVENLPRILPPDLNAQVFLDRWQTLPIFELIQSRGSVTQAEMYRVFNMGLGMLLIAAPESLALLQSLIPEKIYEVGELIPGEKKVVLR